MPNTRTAFWTVLLGAAGAAAIALAAPANATEVKRGGSLVAAITDNPPDIMSGTGTNILTNALSGQVYDGLIKLDREMKVLPGLAKSWEVSPDGKTIAFKLRDGVKWHDGKPLTSEDVRYSFLEINGKHNSVSVATFKAIAAIETPDPLTVVLKMKAADPSFFPWALVQGGALVFPKHIYEGTDPRSNPNNFKPVGTGPFKFKEWVRGSHLIFERNADYFDADKIFLDRLVFQVIPDTGARQIALEKGDVDYLPYFALSPGAVDPLSKSKTAEVIDTVRPALGEIIMFFNLRTGPLATKEVRHAIAHAVDRERLVKLALSGRGRPATGPVRSDNQPFYAADVPKYPRDVAKANALLDQAGFPRKAGGIRFPLRLSYEGTGEGGALQSAGEIMREELKEVGIDLKLMPMDPAAWQETSFIRWDFDMSMGSFLTGPDPQIGVARLYLTEFIQPRNASNLMGYSNPSVDGLFKKAAVEPNPETRAGLYQQAQRMMVEDLPALWLWEKFYPIAVRKGVVGLPSGATHSEGFVGVGWAQ